VTDDSRDDDLDDTELAELRALAGRVGAEREAWEEPPTDLWHRIDADARSELAVVEELPVARPRRSGGPRLGWVLGAAAAAGIVVVGAVLLATQADDGTDVVAAVDLDDLTGVGASGRAELQVSADGTQLIVQTDGVDAGDGFLEVWVISADVEQLVSLGPLRPDGRYDLPPGLDPADFPLVDVSVEPIDGDPTHSGDSVLRGELPF
jgi:anti-sigma-K factor RskA